MLYLHATKMFYVSNGSSSVTNDAKMKKQIAILKNFSFVNNVTVAAHLTAIEKWMNFVPPISSSY